MIGPRRKDDEVHICNDVRKWATWDHYPWMPGYRMKDTQKVFPKGKRQKKWTGWKPKTDEQKIENRKKVMEKDDDRLTKIWLLFRKLLRLPLLKWRITPQEKERNLCTERRRMSDYVRTLLRGARKRSRGKFLRNRPEKQELNTWNQGRKR